MKSRSPHSGEQERSRAIHASVLDLMKAGAFAVLVLGIVRGGLEYVSFGFQFTSSLAISFACVAVSLAFFVLKQLGLVLTACWTLIVGVLVTVALAMLYQVGINTPALFALPVLGLVAVWLTGSRWAAIVVAGLAIAAMLGIEVVHHYTAFEPEGVSSPFGAWLVAAVILMVGAYISLQIFEGYMGRLREVNELAETLAESEYEHRMIVEHSIDPFYRADLEGRLVTISPSIETFAGYKPEEIIGEKLSSFYADPGRRDALMAELARNGGEVKGFDAELIKDNGEKILVSTNTHYWRDREGNILGVEGTVRDITEWRELQDRVAAASKIDLLDRLAGGIAHDFNNLLAIILGHVELMRSAANDPKEVRALADVVEQAANRGTDLSSRMLAFSKSVSQDVAPLQLNDVLTEMQPMLQSSLTPEIDVVLDLDESLWEVKTNPGEFQDALLNLAINARDAMHGCGTLTIRSRNRCIEGPTGGFNPDFSSIECVEVAVADTGEGMSEEVTDMAIEPFFTTKERGSGTGLGLSMVYGLMRRAGGDLVISSKPGRGTNVSMLWPRSCPARRTAMSDPTAKVVARGEERVLVVEDEPALRTLMERRLTRIGYTVVSAATGVEAKAIIESDPSIDIVLSDIVMPGGINGFDLARFVKAEYPHLPIVLNTGFSDESAAEHELDVVVLRKPFSASELADALRTALDSPETLGAAD